MRTTSRLNDRTPTAPLRPTRRRKGAAFLACLLLASLGVAGCGGGRIGPPINPGRQDASAGFESADLRTLGYSRGWRGYPIVTQRQDVAHVAVYDDLLLLLETGSTLSAIDTSDGSRTWSRQLETPITPFLGIAREGNLVYANSSSELFVLDAVTGELRARQRLPMIVSTGPTRFQGQLVFGSSSGEVMGYLPASGVRLWGNTLAHPVEADPIVVDPYVVVASSGGDLVFIDPNSGARVNRVGNGDMFNALYDGPGAAPAAAAGMVIVPSLDQSLYAFTPFDRRFLWRVPTEGPITSRPFVHLDATYATLPGRGMSAVDIGTGEVRWSAGDVGGSVVGVRDGLLIVFDRGKGELVQVDPGTGDVFARAPIPGVHRVISPQQADGPLYLVTSLGLVARFNPDA